MSIFGSKKSSDGGFLAKTTSVAAQAAEQSAAARDSADAAVVKAASGVQMATRDPQRQASPTAEDQLDPLGSNSPKKKAAHRILLGD